MKLVSPYRNIKQYTRILLEAYHMNSDIRNNMKIVLKKKLNLFLNFYLTFHVTRILSSSIYQLVVWILHDC